MTSQDSEKVSEEAMDSLARVCRGRNRSGQQKNASEGHSQAGECRGRNKSGHGKNASERGEPTDWRAQGQVRDSKRKLASEGHSQTREHRQRGKSVGAKESDRARVTHQLESAYGGTSQERKMKQ